MPHFDGVREHCLWLEKWPPPGRMMARAQDRSDPGGHKACKERRLQESPLPGKTGVPYRTLPLRNWINHPNHKYTTLTVVNSSAKFRINCGRGTTQGSSERLQPYGWTQRMQWETNGRPPHRIEAGGSPASHGTHPSERAKTAFKLSAPDRSPLSRAQFTGQFPVTQHILPLARLSRLPKGLFCRLRLASFRPPLGPISLHPFALGFALGSSAGTASPPAMGSRRNRPGGGCLTFKRGTDFSYFCIDGGPL